jgi:hypothetical protein
MNWGSIPEIGKSPIFWNDLPYFSVNHKMEELSILFKRAFKFLLVSEARF